MKDSHCYLLYQNGHCGWLSSRTRREKINHIRTLINVTAESARHEEKQEIENTLISGNQLCAVSAVKVASSLSE